MKTLALTLLLSSMPALGELYSYTNADGDYVVTRTKPTGVTEYAVISDDGEFVRLVHQSEGRIPISHWRPWFIPKEPHPFDYQPDLEADEPTPVVTIEEAQDDS